MSGFTDTFILEANRVHSSQYNNSSNTSIWTNAVNDGITIKQGDTIQLHSAFISDLGAEDATIEFRGKIIQESLTLQKTVYSLGNPNLTFPNYYGRISAVNTSQTFENIRDNRVLFQTEFYKNANGEYYFTLPLEFGNIFNDDINRDWEQGPQHFPYQTSFTSASGKGATTLPPILSKRLRQDWTDVTIKTYHTKDGTSLSASAQFVQVANDNSRYTLFRLKNCEREKVTNSNILCRDPAAYRYVRIKDIIDFEVLKGFNSPQNIASKFTEEMTKPTLSELYQYEINASDELLRKELSKKIQSPTYKLFECATPARYSYSNASEYFGYNASAAYDIFAGSDEAVIHYAAQYEIIGKKRPEFYETGARMMDNVTDNSGFNPNAPEGETLMYLYGFANPNTTNGAGQDEDDYDYIPVSTNLRYTQENLEYIKAFFDSQDNYPELFDIADSNTPYTNEPSGYNGFGGDTITKETHRLLHLNPKVNENMPYVNNACGTNMTNDRQRSFGSDNYHDYRNRSGGSETPYEDYSSVPFFVKYFPEYKDVKDVFGAKYDTETGRGMWGGFAIRVPILYGYEANASFNLNIGFLAQVPKTYTTVVSSKKYLTTTTFDNRHIGFDRHFNSFGNSTICLFNGMNTKYGWSQDRATIVRNGDLAFGENVNSEWYNQVYIGAKQPLFNFDDARSRFYFSDLHSNEVIDTPVNTSLTGLPDDAGTRVYKFNKSLGYRNFTPTMAPYQQNLQFPEATVDSIAYSNKHPYIVANKIYDSLSGVFFTDFGITEDNWKNSFWGICGFEYNDLNFTGGNSQKRITSNNTSGLSYITTNADVLPSAQLGFSAIAQGAPAYLPELSSLKSVIQAAHNNATTNPPDIDYTKDIVELYPPVQVAADSAEIVAANLPTKTLRPYYTIRSDIISDSNFFGGKNEPSLMPVIAVLDKMNQYGDFFYSGGAGQLSFTATQQKVITEVKTQICDPSGEPAILSPNSCVMYKIIKRNNANLNVIGDIIAEEQQKKK